MATKDTNAQPQSNSPDSNNNSASLEELFKRNSLEDLLSQTSPDDLLDKAKSDTAIVQAENKNREAQFRERRNQTAKRFERITGEKMPDDADQAIREYRAVLQQKDNIKLFVDQQDLFLAAGAAQAANNQSARPAPPPGLSLIHI